MGGNKGIKLEKLKNVENHLRRGGGRGGEGQYGTNVHFCR